jgi:hypothetical protein
LEEDLRQELASLREENKILRDSLVEIRKDETPADGAGSQDCMWRAAAGKLGCLAGRLREMLAPVAERVKRRLSPGTARLSDKVGRQLAANPLPWLFAALGAGFLISRLLDRR